MNLEFEERVLYPAFKKLGYRILRVEIEQDRFIIDVEQEPLPDLHIHVTDGMGTEDKLR